LWALFFSQFATGSSDIGAVRLDSITDQVNAGAKVRTVFVVGSDRKEITWVWEHGAWRIADASFIRQARVDRELARKTSGPRETRPPANPAAVTKSSRAARPPSMSVAFRIGFGSASAGGDFASSLESIGSTSLGIDVARPISKHWSVVTGLGYNPLGVAYNVTIEESLVAIEEEVGTLQIPALAQLNLPVSGPVATLRLNARAGLALDLAVSRGGSFSGPAEGSLASVDWYDEHNFVNLAGVLGAGIELGFGAEPSLLFGFDVTTQRHLFDEWTDEQFTNGANYKYSATHFGLSLRYLNLR
jgi:hypothetical protein